MDSGIICDWATLRQKEAKCVKITFPSMVTARAFHYQFKDMEWESDNGTQTILIRLHHVKFDTELFDPQVRLAVNTCGQVTPHLINSIVGRIAN